MSFGRVRTDVRLSYNLMMPRARCNMVHHDETTMHSNGLARLCFPK